MNGEEPTKRLVRAARQIIETEELLGGDFIPAERNPLPGGEAAGQSFPGEMTAPQKDEALKAVYAELRDCGGCQLCKCRSNVVFGEGNPAAAVVFIGEGPGADEDATGRPFVGRAGELLTKMIQAMGLRRQDVYICNVVKCRPPNNRTPMPEEVESCWEYLVRQLQIIHPKAIVTLGNPATQKLLGTRTGITKLRGQWHDLPPIGQGLEGIRVMPTFHPAYILRQYTPDNRKKVWSDLQKVMDLLGLEPPNKK